MTLTIQNVNSKFLVHILLQFNITLGWRNDTSKIKKSYTFSVSKIDRVVYYDTNNV